MSRDVLRSATSIGLRQLLRYGVGALCKAPRHAYIVEPGINGWRAASDAWLASCRHSRVLSATVRATHAAANWDASPQQLLGLLTDGWNRTVHFTPTRTMCVNVTARQTVRAN